MSADIIQAQYDRLAAVAQQFAQQAQAVAALQQHVARTAQTLRQGGWEGRGAASFGAEMDTVVLPVMRRLHNQERMSTEIVVQESVDSSAGLTGR